MYDTNWKDLLLIHTQLPLSNVSFEGLKHSVFNHVCPFFMSAWLLMHIVRQLKLCHGLLKRFHTVVKHSWTELIAQERTLCC